MHEIFQNVPSLDASELIQAGAIVHNIFELCTAQMDETRGKPTSIFEVVLYKIILDVFISPCEGVTTGIQSCSLNKDNYFVFN